ncbi:MAG: LolA family protein [Terriglobales bacterium]
MKKLLTLALLLSLTTAAAAAPPPDAKSIAEAVDRRYNNLRSLRAEFTEIYRGAGIERTESGTLWLKRPGKMRWEYRQPREKLFLTDGKDAWFYVPGERQARKAPLKKLDDLRSPLRYLLGRTKLAKEFDDLALAVDVTPLTRGNVMLRGAPRGLADRVTAVLLEITPESRIARLLIEEVDGASTEFRFANMAENPAVSDQKFQLSLPADVEVVESTEQPAP